MHLQSSQQDKVKEQNTSDCTEILQLEIKPLNRQPIMSIQAHSNYPQRLFSALTKLSKWQKWRELEFSHFSDVFVHYNKHQLSTASCRISISWSHFSSLEGRKISSLNPARQHQICQPLTILDVVEHDELLPAQLLHQRQHDVIEADRWPGSQRVALPAGARVELAGGPRRSLTVPLDVQVRDVHGVCQGLQRAGRCTARRRHQRQDALVHQLACWRGQRRGGKKVRAVKSGRFEESTE